MKKLIILLVLAFHINANAQTYVTIPDAYFAIRLQNLIPAAMNGNQMDITHPLVTTTTHSIDVHYPGSNPYITNLFGVQYFTSLTYLNCNGNQLTSLPTLPDSLIYLDCGYNVNLASLPTLPSKLTHLDCWNTQMASLPALPSTLAYLNCSGSYMTGNLTSLPVLPNSLTYLDCSGHANLTQLPTLPNSLTHLACRQDGLTSLPSLPDSLTYLDCSYNNIPCFPTFPSSITAIYLDPNNAYNCLPNYIAAMDATDLAKPLCATGNSNSCPVAMGVKSYKNANEQASIYPNPCSDRFTVRTNAAQDQSVELYEINGRCVFSQSISDRTEINVTPLPDGIYTLTIKMTDRIINKKVVILR